MDVPLSLTDHQGKPVASPAKSAMYNRINDRRRGKVVFYPIRYADDFVVLVSGQKEDAMKEKEALADFLKESLKLELSEEKTLVTPLTQGFYFLGHRVRLCGDIKTGYWAKIEIPEEKIKDLKYRLKQKTKRNRLYLSLREIIKEFNPILRGWGYFYRHCHGAKKIFSAIDDYVWRRIYRWLRKKYRNLSWQKIAKRFFKHHNSGRRKRWADGLAVFLVAEISVYRFSLKWMRYPNFAIATGEPSA
jgi:RNA-directed DNA polymerase